MKVEEFKYKKNMLKVMLDYYNSFILLKELEKDTNNMKDNLEGIGFEDIEDLRYISNNYRDRVVIFLDRLISDFELENEIEYNAEVDKNNLSDFIIGHSYIENALINLFFNIELKSLSGDKELKNCYNLFEKDLFIEGCNRYLKYIKEEG